MIRKLALIAPFALIGLSACDNNPAVLAKAQTGECFAVVGKEKNGAPKLEKTACSADDAATATPETLTATTTAATPAGAAAPSCPATPACPSVTAASGGGKVVKASHKAKRKGWFSRRGARSETQTEVRDYARVEQDYVHPPLPQELFGAPNERREDSQWSRNSENSYSFRFNGAPSARPMKRRRDERQYSYSERGQDYNPPAPPAPLPAPPPLKGYDTHGDRSPHLDGQYSSPPPAYGVQGYSAEGYGASSRYGASKRYESRSYSSESSSSSRYSESQGGSAYGSGGYAYGSGHSGSGPCCQTARGNGPHFPVDENGYLTWRGKTPAN